MNSTVGWQNTLRSVMFNAPAETEMAALQMMCSANISHVILISTAFITLSLPMWFYFISVLLIWYFSMYFMYVYNTFNYI